MRLLAVILVIFLLVGCSAMVMGGGTSSSPALGSDNRSAAQIDVDHAIRKAVNSAIFLDGGIPSGSVDVSAGSGTVTLKGTVSEFDIRDRAVSIARNVDGVVRVDNQIRVVSQ